jgi:hypothetical protein
MFRSEVADGKNAQILCTVQVCCLGDKYAKVKDVPELVDCAYISYFVSLYLLFIYLFIYSFPH